MCVCCKRQQQCIFVGGSSPQAEAVTPGSFRGGQVKASRCKGFLCDKTQKGGGGGDGDAILAPHTHEPPNVCSIRLVKPFHRQCCPVQLIVSPRGVVL